LHYHIIIALSVHSLFFVLVEGRATQETAGAVIIAGHIHIDFSQGHVLWAERWAMANQPTGPRGHRRQKTAKDHEIRCLPPRATHQ
jgi:hypothetical protein